MDHIVITKRMQHAEIIVDAVLFDMDGTLTDSIGAVEAAWGGVAEELGMDRDEVIEATHGKRAIDNLKALRDDLKNTPSEQMDPHVEEFEQRILNNADEYKKTVRERRESAAASIRSSRSNSRRGSRSASVAGSQPDSRSSSPGPNKSRPGSFAAEVTRKLKFTNLSSTADANGSAIADDARSEKSVDARSEKSVMYDEDAFYDDDEEIDIDTIEVDTSDLIDNSVRILPGVRRMIDSIPKGRYAVATSGAKTYCHGCLSRVGITPPEVTITADDKRLERGKPFPDPFILAAKCLGYDVTKCLVVEDSPSGIRAGVASGARTIAVATSHPFEKIKDSGAHFFVPTLDYVRVEVREDGRLKILIDKKYGEEVADETAAEAEKLKNSINPAVSKTDENQSEK